MNIPAGSRIAIYTRVSRDDYGENHGSLENQRDLLLEFVRRNGTGQTLVVYEDDNASGSAFDRKGLESLKADVEQGRVDLLLVKDLSRLGRNNAKTLQFLDFLEERGVRVISCDGRFDSALDSDMLGIETWVNERYIRDISRKIRSSLQLKISRGEYIGKAPFGYRKLPDGRNRLCVYEPEGEIVRKIYSLYLAGYGYTSIAVCLDKSGSISPEGGQWNRITVRRILCSRAYIGDTVQGVSEKVSFKSKRTRRLPKGSWVVTENTHEPIISREDFLQVQRSMEAKRSGQSGWSVSAENAHVLRGLIFCGTCGSAMYARRRRGEVIYVCGRYCRNGSEACRSHFTYEEPITRAIIEETADLVAPGKWREDPCLPTHSSAASASDRAEEEKRLDRQLGNCRRKQKLIYSDRLEGRISDVFFTEMNKEMEQRIALLEKEQRRFRTEMAVPEDIGALLTNLADRLRTGWMDNSLARIMVSRITVQDEIDAQETGGSVIIDFRKRKD